MYKTLNDAQVINRMFAAGNCKIWYMRPDFTMNGMMGFRWMREHGVLPDIKSLEKTHILLGEIIGSSGFEYMYVHLQGETYSPNGEARDLIQGKGLSHTSMSMGDIFESNGSFYMVDSLGFKQLT
jgi:hypothetical protein